MDLESTHRIVQLTTNICSAQLCVNDDDWYVMVLFQIINVVRPGINVYYVQAFMVAGRKLYDRSVPLSDQCKFFALSQKVSENLPTLQLYKKIHIQWIWESCPTLQLYDEKNVNLNFLVFTGKFRKIWQLYNSTRKYTYMHFGKLSNSTTLRWKKC